MPYDYPDNVPEYVENLPTGAQRICVSAFNNTMERTKDEDQARIACWGAIKNVYEQNAEGDWVPKAKEGKMLNLADVDTTSKAYAIHNKIHSEYVDARFGHRKKADMQEDHEQIVRYIMMLGGHHISKGEALDGTLPAELREPAKLRYVSDSIILNDTQPVTSTIQVFRTGTFYHPQYGKFTITGDTLKSMLDNFTAGKPKAPTEMLVDYDHLSIANDEPLAGRAAGWVKALTNGDAIYAEVEWTEEAAEFIRNKQFRFISPEWHMNYHDKESDKTIGPTLLSIALTNRPFLEGMEPVVLSDELAGTIALSDKAIAALNVMVAADTKTKTDEEVAADELSKSETIAKAALEAGVGKHNTGKNKKGGLTMLDEKQCNELTELMGIGEGDVLAAVRALKTKAETQAPALDEVQTLRDQVTAETKRADDLQTEKDTQEHVTLVDKAIADKKILPKMKDWAMTYVAKDKDGFVAFIETAEIVGPDMKVLGKNTGNKDAKITEMEVKIAKKLGVTEEMLMAEKEREAGVAEEES